MAQDIITLDRIDEIMREVFRELDRRDGRARGSEVLAAVEPRVKLNSYEKATTETGAVRWDTHIRFYTSDCVKAGFLTKASGYWTLTDEGREALKLPSGELIRLAKRKYRAWRKQRNDSEGEPSRGTQAAKDGPDVETDDSALRRSVYDRAVEQAQAQIEQAIDNLGPYEFQQLVQHLLEGMGYYVPFNAPRGPDGGVDLIAYRDPLGVTGPRIKCQVKHRDEKSAVSQIRELQGLLGRSDDVGLVISSGGFTSESEKAARASSHCHIELMDLGRFVELWRQHYDKIKPEGKAMLPLLYVAFLAPDENT